MSRRWQAYLLLLLNTVTWGAALIVVKPALSVTTPFRFLLYRYVLAMLLSIPLLWHYRHQLVKPGLLGKVLGLELIGTTLALSLLYLGLARTSAIEASLITTTTPVFVVALGVWLLRERLHRHEATGLLIALLGTGLLALWPLWSGQQQLSQVSLAGNLFIIGQNIATAAYVILAKKTYRRYPKLLVTTVSFYVGALTFLVLSWLEIGSGGQILLSTILTDIGHRSVWMASGYMALFGSIIGLTAYIKGQDLIEASEASLFWYLQPAVYIPLGLVLLGEKIQPIQLISLGIIILGVWWAERRKGML